MRSLEFQALSLSQCAQFDKTNNLKAKLTGWGTICKLREEQGISRSQRVNKFQRKQKKGGK